MINKLLKYVGVAVACLVVVVLSSALLYRKYLQHKVAEELAITSPNGINSLEAVRIGGIDQWIELRGQNVSYPSSCSFMVDLALLSFRWRARGRALGREISW